MYEYDTRPQMINRVATSNGRPHTCHPEMTLREKRQVSGIDPINGSHRRSQEEPHLSDEPRER